MEPLLVFPDPAPATLATALELGGYSWRSVGSAEGAAKGEPEDGWSGGVVCADEHPDGAFAICRA
ncbi:MAG: hypothetical protein ACREQ5_36320, partial [Candidatus Dormibacteria bacterium]